MRRLLLACALLLVCAPSVHAGQPVLRLLYSANTYGTLRPCPS